MRNPQCVLTCPGPTQDQARQQSDMEKKELVGPYHLSLSYWLKDSVLREGESLPDRAQQLQMEGLEHGPA